MTVGCLGFNGHIAPLTLSIILKEIIHKYFIAHIIRHNCDTQNSFDKRNCVLSNADLSNAQTKTGICTSIKYLGGEGTEYLATDSVAWSVCPDVDVSCKTAGPIELPFGMCIRLSLIHISEPTRPY